MLADTREDLDVAVMKEFVVVFCWTLDHHVFYYYYYYFCVPNIS